MSKALLAHNFQHYPSGLVLLLASSKDEKADILNGFIGYFLVLCLLFMLLKLANDPSLETDLPLSNTSISIF